MKTPYERALLTRSVELSSRAMREAMKAARPGAFEYTVKAALEREWSSGGALGWGYPPIVASGPNATILHYPRYSAGGWSRATCCWSTPPPTTST